MINSPFDPKVTDAAADGQVIPCLSFTVLCVHHFASACSRNMSTWAQSQSGVCLAQM